MGTSLCALWPLSGGNLQLGYGLSGVPQVQNGSMFVELQVGYLLPVAVSHKELNGNCCQPEGLFEMGIVWLLRCQACIEIE